MYSEDRKLAKRLMAGEEPAFDEFFHQYYPRIFRFCQRRMPEADAEEAALEAMRQGMRRIDTYRGEALLITWMYQVARSQVSAHFKRTNKHRHLVLVEDDEEVRNQVETMAMQIEETPEALRDAEQRQKLIHFMLDSLPGHYGQVLEWKYVQGFSVEEIAEKLTTSTTAIQSMLARARTAFRKTYADIEAGLAADSPVAITSTREI